MKKNKKQKESYFSENKTKSPTKGRQMKCIQLAHCMFVLKFALCILEKNYRKTKFKNATSLSVYLSVDQSQIDMLTCLPRIEKKNIQTQKNQNEMKKKVNNSNSSIE